MSLAKMDPMAQMLLKMLFCKWRRMVAEGKAQELSDDLDKAIEAIEEDE